MTDKFKSFLIRKLGFTKVESEKILYGFKLFFTDFSKLSLLFLLFWFMNLGSYYLWTTLFTVPLRSQIGGFHLKTYWTCLLTSLTYYICVLFATSLQTPYLIALSLGIFSLGVITMIAPSVPKQRKRLKVDRLLLKKRALTIGSAYLIFFIVRPDQLSTIALWVLIIQSTLLLSQEVYHVSQSIKNI